MNSTHLIHLSAMDVLFLSRPRPLFQSRRLLSVWLFSLLTICCGQSTLGQQPSAPRVGAISASQQATGTQGAAPENFDQLAAAADAAREGDRLEEAIAAYRKA